MFLGMIVQSGLTLVSLKLALIILFMFFASPTATHALAQADVSIAMGKGSDIAMDVAKMTLITSDLQSIPKALALSKKTVLGIRQNLFWAFIYNIIGRSSNNQWS